MGSNLLVAARVPEGDGFRFVAIEHFTDSDLAELRYHELCETYRTTEGAEIFYAPIRNTTIVPQQ